MKQHIGHRSLTIITWLFLGWMLIAYQPRSLLLSSAPTSSKLNGFGLTFSQLQALRNGTLIAETKQRIKRLQRKSSRGRAERNELMTLREQLALLLMAQDKLFWHLSIPTTGMYLVDEWYPPRYPYTPHFFSLWDLAPHKGRGIRVVDINTGVAAFSLKNNPAVRKHRDLFMPITFEYTYNIVSQRGHDPVNQLVDQLKPYLDPQRFSQVDVAQCIPSWVLEYQQQGTTKRLQEYLQKFGAPDVINTIGSLTDKGRKALHDVIDGTSGIKTQAEFFSLCHLTQPVVPQPVVESFLPLTPITSSPELSLFLSHGSHTFGLIGACADDHTPDQGIVGIAPCAEVISIKAFRPETMASTKSTLTSALQKALDYHADVVNLSLKISDALDMATPSSQHLKELVDRIDYVVAASGNNGDPQFPHYAGATLSYPARFPSVALNVGAFGYDDGSAYIAPFSQYEKNVGPKFVAPGVAIFSAGMLPDQREDSAYVFLNGTSMASSIITGFIALMLAEFKDDFSRDQLLHVCYQSGFRLADTQEWKDRTLFGALDMRTALFMLQVLRAVKEKNLVNDFDKKFNDLVTAVCYLLIEPMDTWSTRYLCGLSFKNNMLAYITQAQTYTHSRYLKNFYIPMLDSFDHIPSAQCTHSPYVLNDAIEYYVGILASILDPHTQRPSLLFDTMAHALNRILHAEKVE